MAASIKMRKFGSLPDHGAALPGVLQCGRIYKDAEITVRTARGMACAASFNVAASIKMRKSDDESQADRGIQPPSMWPHL